MADLRPRSNSPTPAKAQCQQYLLTGSCVFGDNCRFDHSKPQPPPPKAKGKAKTKAAAESS